MPSLRRSTFPQRRCSRSGAAPAPGTAVTPSRSHGLLQRRRDAEGTDWRDQPVYNPNSYGGPVADPSRAAEVHWEADGDMVRTAYALRPDDDDWGQAGTLVRKVLDDAARDRLVSNIVGHLLNGVSEKVLLRAFEYWHNVDKDLGDRVEKGVRAGQA